MSKKIEDILLNKGSMLSSRLATIYEKEYNTNNVNARQAISRAVSAGGNVMKNSELPFQNNQKFIFHKSQYQSSEYWEDLRTAICEHSVAINSIVLAIKNQGGFISKNNLAAYSISPVSNLKGHLSYETIISKMMRSNLIQEFDDSYFQLNRDAFPDLAFNFSNAKAIEFAKKMIVTDYIKLLKNTNVISYYKARLDSEFAHFNWAFTAPSYIQGVARRNKNEPKPIPGFIIADVVWSKNATLDDISFFTRKIDIISQFRIQNFLPMLIVQGLKPEALAHLKDKGVVIALIEEVLGKPYAQLLNDLIKVITNATAILAKNPEKLDEMFKKIASLEGTYNNIIGDLFELMVAELYQSVSVRYLEVNKQVEGRYTKSGNPKEIDVFLEKDGKNIVIECKAQKSPVDDKFIETWLSKKIVDIRHYLINNSPFSSRDCEFQIWSVSGFTSEAETLLRNSQNNNKYSIKFFDKTEMLKFAKDNKANNFLDRIKKYFST